MPSKTARGRFITFEGPEGSGKSTQLRRAAARLRKHGCDVLETAEPGGTPIGKQIRRVLLDAANQDLRPTTELLLMFASRAQNVEENILPALSQGRVVLCDRFTDSTLVYQGSGRGMGSEVVYELDRIASRGLVPDLTLMIDIDTESGLARAHARNAATNDVETRLDHETLAFHRKVGDAFRQLASDEPGRVKLIDGARSEEEVAEDVWLRIAALLQIPA